MRILLFVIFISFTSSTYANRFLLDIGGQYSRQMTDPSISKIGGTSAISYFINHMLSSEIYFNYNMYDVKYVNDVKYDFTEYHYGLGFRIYFLKKLYLRPMLGRIYQKNDVSSSTQWTYGVGGGYILNFIPKVNFNFGADYFRFNDDSYNIINLRIGLLFFI